MSIIEKPGLSKGYNRAEYLGESKPPTVREQLRGVMDSVLPACKDFESFLAALQEAGAEVKHGKQLSFKLPSAKRFTRQDTLGDNYSFEAILERISGKRTGLLKEKPHATTNSSVAPNLLIDIDAKLREGKGAGFEYWARHFNLKAMSQTLIFIQENGFESYEALAEATNAICSDCNQRLEIKKRHSRIKIKSQ